MSARVLSVASTPPGDSCTSSPCAPRQCLQSDAAPGYKKALQKLKGRAFMATGAMCTAYALAMAFIYKLFCNVTPPNQYGVSAGKTCGSFPCIQQHVDSNDLRPSLFLPDLFIGGLTVMISAFFAAFHPRDLGAAEARSKLVPICLVAMLGDLATIGPIYERFLADRATAPRESTNEMLIRSIHFGLAGFCLVYQNLYCSVYVCVYRGYCSWAWYRQCLAIDGVTFLTGILALHALGETRFPPGMELTFAASLVRPAASLMQAVLFNARVRDRIHELTASCRHVPVHLHELRHNEVLSFFGSQGMQPTASGNAPSWTVASSSGGESAQLKSHYTSKLGGIE